MPQTLKQYAIFNIPINPDTNVAPEDAWLFQDPIKTFAVGTPEKLIFTTYMTAARRGPRFIGLQKVPSRLILKVRHVHYTDWTKVLGADAAMAKEQTSS
jgi:hypothetical protein